MTARLDGKIILVTGADGGIGRAIVARLLRDGAKVVASDLKAPASEAPKDRLLGLAQDVSDEGIWKATIDRILDWGGRVDGLVNNAGICHREPITGTSPDALDLHYRVNQRGTALGMQAVFEPMRRVGGGSIVNLSSLAGLKAFTHSYAYGPTKWAIRGMSKMAAIEFGPHGIRVNSIQPGAIETQMLVGMTPELDAMIPLKRRGQPDDIAPVVSFLLSEDAKYVTGAEVTVDGGLGL